MKSRFKGSLLLSAIGDALGWMTEFERDSFSLQKKFGVKKIDQFYDWDKQVGGRYYGFIDSIKGGSYSDDTQLSFAVARSLKDDGDIDNELFSKIELADWLYYARGGGRTLKVAANKIQRKSAKWNTNFFNFKIGDNIIDYRDCGANGAAMRILPIALANIGNLDKIKKNIFTNSIITHGHGRAVIGAIIYGIAVNQVYNYSKDNFVTLDFLTDFGKNIHNYLTINFNEIDGIPEWLTKWNTGWHIDFETHYSEIIEEVHLQLQGLFIAIRDETPFKKVLSDLGCFRNETKGSGTATVLAGLYLFLINYNKPLDGIINAVNSLGSDTDSIAAFTGGLFGSLYGNSIIPRKWLNIQDKDYLEKTAERLFNINKGNGSSLPFNLNPITSGINELSKDKLVKDDTFSFNPLGLGKVTNIERQPVLTKGKYALIIDVDFELGQTCRFSKVCEGSVENIYKNDFKKESTEILTLAKYKLSDEGLKELKILLDNISNGYSNSIILSEDVLRVFKKLLKTTL
jgi:ADP-ribosylglycohydrolase